MACWKKGYDVTNRQIKNCALSITSDPDFKASKGWLAKFINRCRKEYDSES